ncbi:MAG TPA: carboxylating nicotinate-nucleotide diphosphorylase, partial [Terriglobia bacterium]|nr:carboxylating nicotinate-nucleotide diphosphorylase [Terriglobia bacterium]
MKIKSENSLRESTGSIEMLVIDLTQIRDVLQAALQEDIGTGDITSRATIPESATAIARYTTKQALSVSGLPVAAELIRMVDSKLKFKAQSADGDYVETGTVIAEMTGSARSILAVERVTLNLLQRMCGIATLTRHYVDRVRGTKARVIDTRKTALGLRLLDKYAVACGGGTNHRIGLFDAVLIKNNHLIFHKSLTETLAEARRNLAPSVKLEVEVTSMEQLEEAITAKADVILLDNFTPDQTRHAVIQCGGRVPLESSGGITLDNIRDYAVAGVDRISVGALTHSVVAADIHLRVTPGV